MSSAGPSAREAGRSGSRHVVGPLLLLGVGILLLLNNLGVVPWSIWQALWPFWPVLLVLLGLEAFVTGRVAWGTLVLLIVLLPIVGLVVSAGSLGRHWREATRGTPTQETQRLRQPLEGATSAAVEVEYGGGALDVGALPDSLAGEMLADGQVFGHGTIRFEGQSTLRDGRRTLKVSPRDGGGAFDFGRLQLRLTPSVPIDLTVEAGLAETTLDLERLQVPRLTVETGASQTRIVLPARGRTTAQIEGGATSLDVRVPEGVAARIVVEGGANAVEIDERRFPRQGGEYRSPDFETAENWVTLRMEVGASRVVVQ